MRSDAGQRRRSPLSVDSDRSQRLFAPCTGWKPHEVVHAVLATHGCLTDRSRSVTAKSEKDRMLAGERYTFLDPELEAERARAKELLRLFNSAASSTERQDVLVRLLGNVGHGSTVEPPFYCTYGRNTYLGDHVYLNFSCVIIDNNEVHIGDHCMIGPAVQIYTAAHPLQAEPRMQGWEVARPVRLEDNVWVGGGAILLPGVCIGRDAVVGAGAVVTRDVPASTVVAGNPARVIREIEQ
jgi:maltose O-acetyltransferase